MINNLDIHDGDSKYYGGDQAWLKEVGVDDYYINRACAIISCANFLVALSQMPKFQTLDIKNDKKSYIELSNEILKYIKPTPFGIFTLGQLERGFINYLNKRGIEVSSIKRKINSRYDLMDMNNIVRNGYPLLMLNWFHKNKNFDRHWITITKIDEAGFIASNWGEKRYYSHDELFSSKTPRWVITFV
ncbi:MAG: hypothetical protein MR314_02105 [Ezakiella sp.]|nr:hypothetical protein [Ezakiella sp.]